MSEKCRVCYGTKEISDLANGGCLPCPHCGGTGIEKPKHETVEQWEERTGGTYPDDGPVWSCYRNLLSPDNGIYWKLEEWWDTKPHEWDSPKPAIVANHYGKPKE